MIYYRTDAQMTTALDSSFFEFFEFWIWTNHNSLLSIATNQFASFFIDIRSCQCYFRVCQSGEIWNKRAFFLCILIFLLYKTNRFHAAPPRVSLFCSYHILTSSVIYYWTDPRQHGIYLLNSRLNLSWQINKKKIPLGTTACVSICLSATFSPRTTHKQIC